VTAAADMAVELETRLHRAVMANSANASLLARLPQLDLPDAWLVAGCLFQAVWNEQFGRAPDAGVNDYDVFYFDDRDLSYEAEDAVIRRVTAALSDQGIRIEVKNQARVHLWYGERFGPGYPHLTSARDGIDRFLIAGTCIGYGVSKNNHRQLYAPYGLDDIFAGLLRPNTHNQRTDRYAQKAASYRERWPHLRCLASDA
jgi:uncharacterized protein